MTIEQNYKITNIKKFYFKIQSFILAGKKILFIINNRHLQLIAIISCKKKIS